MGKRNGLNRRDALLLLYLRWHIWHFGYAPTRKELSEALSYGVSTVNKRLYRLAALGKVRVEPSWRGLRLTQSQVDD